MHAQTDLYETTAKKYDSILFQSFYCVKWLWKLFYLFPDLEKSVYQNVINSLFPEKFFMLLLSADFFQSKEEGKDQEWIQSNTTPDHTRRHVLEYVASLSKGSLMRTKHICVLIHIRVKGEVGTLKHVQALQ